MNVESWCLVEGDSKASWARANRKHFPHALESTVFDVKLPDRFDNRKEQIPLEELAKRKHFKEKCKLVKIIIDILKVIFFFNDCR